MTDDKGIVICYVVPLVIALTAKGNPKVKNRESKCLDGALFGLDGTSLMKSPSLHQDSAMLCAAK